MSGNSSPGLEQLLNGLLDGVLSEAEEAQLAGILRADAAARCRYRQFMLLHSDLTWDYAAAAVPAAEPALGATARTRASASGSGWGWRVSAIAAGLALLAALGALWFSGRGSGPRAIATLESAAGAVSWSDGGSQRAGLVAGAVLPEGTLLVESDGGSAQLRFHDGTSLTVSGEAEVGFSDAGQKRLSVRRGTLTAQVQRQPAGKPLIIRTATAEVEVLGTEFSLSADTRQTAVSVEKGTVRMRRLADGRTVDIAGQQTAIASLEGKGEFRSAKPNMPPVAWRYTFEVAPPPQSKGEWLPAGESGPGRARAVPLVAARGKDGVPIIHYGISLRASTSQQGGLVTLGSSSVLTGRARLERPAMLKLFLSCVRGGSFGGNFELTLPRPEPGADGWVSFRVPLAGARPVMPGSHAQMDGAQVALLVLHSIETDAGLEVADLGIEPLESFNSRQ